MILTNKVHIFKKIRKKTRKSPLFCVLLVSIRLIE